MARRFDLAIFFALAFGITWLADLPLALATARGEAPAPWALALGGLGAWGPTIAAAIVAGLRRELRQVFGRWRTQWRWIAAALALPIAIHAAANALEVALGGHPAQWFYPPVRPEHFAALVMFSLGEEFGWRGFAYPRLAERWGPAAGAAILGALWGLWHLFMWFTPETGAPPVPTLALRMADLALYSVAFAWVFERGGRSMALAIAFHAAGHLDNVFRAPADEVRLWVLRYAVLASCAAVAARALSKSARPVPARTG